MTISVISLTGLRSIARSTLQSTPQDEATEDIVAVAPYFCRPLERLLECECEHVNFCKNVKIVSVFVVSVKLFPSRSKNRRIEELPPKSYVTDSCRTVHGETRKEQNSTELHSSILHRSPWWELDYEQTCIASYIGDSSGGI